MSASSRIKWIDAARGLGVILVVFGHVERGLTTANIPGNWEVTDFMLYTFHMPLFFFLAGLNAAHGVRRGATKFLRGKLDTVLYPYLLWSIIQGVILAMASSATNSKSGFSDLLYIGWRPMGQFWFLYALLLCQVALALIGSRMVLLVGAAMLAFVGSQFLPNDVILERFLYSLPFFLGGVIVASRVTSLEGENGLLPPVALCLLFAVAAWFAWRFGGGDYSSFAGLPAALAGIAMMLAVARALRGRALALAAWIGEASMSIYVMHIIVASGLRIVLLKVGVPPIAAIYAPACTVAGVVAPLTAHAILARLKLLPAFGLAPWHRKAPPPSLAVAQS